MSSSHPSSPSGAPRPGKGETGSSTPTVVAVFLAVGATVLGLAALAAASLGVAAMRTPGLALLGLGGLLAAMVRWPRGQNDLDNEALAHLAAASAELAGGNPTGAGWEASKAVSAAVTSRTRNRALTTLAWAALGQGYAERAKAVLDRVEPSHSVDVQCLGAVEAACGRTDIAIQALEVARSAGTLNCEGAKLLVDCHLRTSGIERAVVAAIQTRRVLGRENCELVADAARAAGAHAAAATLAAAIRDGTDARGPGPSLPGQAIGSAAARHG